jgi:hypothetical protein
MDNLSVQEITRGIVDDSMKSSRVALVELLANKVAELTEPLTKDEFTEVFVIALTALNNQTNSELVHLFTSLLSNSTILEENINNFLKFLDSSEKFMTIFKASVEKFLDYNSQLESDEVISAESWKTLDCWENIGNVLCNLCQTEAGRTMVLRQSNRYMVRIISQVK